MPTVPPSEPRTSMCSRLFCCCIAFSSIWLRHRLRRNNEFPADAFRDRAVGLRRVVDVVRMIERRADLAARQAGAVIAVDCERHAPGPVDMARPRERVIKR